MYSSGWNQVLARSSREYVPKFGILSTFTFVLKAMLFRFCLDLVDRFPGVVWRLLLLDFDDLGDLGDLGDNR